MSDESDSREDYEKLRQLLEQQGEFPIDYIHKFIGENSAEFELSVRSLEAAHPQLQLQNRRESGAGNHVAYTYVLKAQSAEEVILLFKATRRLVGIRLIL
jgi:putative lipoic acid-binding regulatory protein